MFNNICLPLESQIVYNNNNSQQSHNNQRQLIDNKYARRYECVCVLLSRVICLHVCMSE